MKQKAVIKVTMNGARCRTKAMKLAVSATGVTSAELQADENQIVIIGDEVDITSLTALIRKKVGFTEIVSLTPVTEEETPQPQPEPTPEPPQPSPEFIWDPYRHPYGIPRPYWCDVYGRY